METHWDHVTGTHSRGRKTRARVRVRAAYPWRLNTRIQAWTLGPRTQRHRRVVREVNSTARENVSKAELEHGSDEKSLLHCYGDVFVLAKCVFLQRPNTSQTETLMYRVRVRLRRSSFQISKVLNV